MSIVKISYNSLWSVHVSTFRNLLNQYVLCLFCKKLMKNINMKFVRKDFFGCCTVSLKTASICPKQTGTNGNKLYFSVFSPLIIRIINSDGKGRNIPGQADFELLSRLQLNWSLNRNIKELKLDSGNTTVSDTM